MKKIIFGGFCMLTFAISMMAMLLSAVKLNETYGAINGKSSIPTYLNVLNFTPAFYFICILGLFGFVIGVWGVFEKRSK